LTSESLTVSREDRVLRLTLNREEKRNALSIELCHALACAFDEACKNPKVGAVLIDAKGPVFSAGMDLDEVLQPDAAPRTYIHEKIFTIGARITKPIVAAVQGPALGGGLGLIANAHVAIAAQGCSFGLTEIRIAMWPFVIFRSIKTAIGERRAVELSLTGRIFGTPEAMQLGLIHEVVPAIELDDRATAVATQLAESSSQAIATGLEFVHAARDANALTFGKLANEYRGRAFESADFIEGVNAFREKRKPRWRSTT
jgi:enoyl-CoA hydratase/carnithine racemase